MDTAAYRPAPQVLDRLRHVTLAGVVGPTAVGKSTIIAAALAREPRVHYFITHTSREPRPGEREGVDYYFEPRAAMETKMAAGEYVQVAPSVFGDLYATEPGDYSPTGVTIGAIISQAMPAFRALPFKRVRSIFVVPPDYATWQQRIRAHNFSPAQLPGRLAEAERSLVYALEDENTHLIINSSLAAATEDFITLALGKPLPPRLLADQARAREIVRNLLEQVRTSLT